MDAFPPVWSGEDSKLPGCSKELANPGFLKRFRVAGYGFKA